MYRNIKYYLIAGERNDTKILAHETAHAYYYLDKKYRKEIDKIMAGFSTSFMERRKKKLLKAGYCEKVILDEIHAYCITNYLYKDKKDRRNNEKIYDVFMRKNKG